MNKAERIKMVKAMEYIVRNLNDEEIFYRWLVTGVADGDIEYGDLSEESDAVEYYTENDNFSDLMAVFLGIMARAHKSGGLYCDGIVSA